MSIGEDFEIHFGDRFATADTDDYLPVEGFRSGHPGRPTILIGAWYYPHELRRQCDAREGDGKTGIRCVRESGHSGPHSVGFDPGAPTPELTAIADGPWAPR